MGHREYTTEVLSVVSSGESNDFFTDPAQRAPPDL